MNRDDDGQAHSAFRSCPNKEKCLNELIGLAKGLLADNILQPAEVDFLITWMKANEHISSEWPASVLFNRVERALEDGVIDDEERQELFEILKQLTGDQLEENCSTSLPLTNPQPEIEFVGTNFCLTGKFAYGPRRLVEKLVTEKGGFIAERVTQDLCYLVIGTLSSRDWVQTSYGRKIEAAVNNIKKGSNTAILSEDHFLKCALK